VIYAALALIVAQLAGAAFFALNGSWVLAGLLALGVVGLLLVTRAVLGRRRPPQLSPYVEREHVGW
jgi:hypothetical protein